MDFEGRPENGSPLKPGGTDAWELKYGFSPFGGVQYAAEARLVEVLLHRGGHEAHVQGLTMAPGARHRACSRPPPR